MGRARRGGVQIGGRSRGGWRRAGVSPRFLGGPLWTLARAGGLPLGRDRGLLPVAPLAERDRLLEHALPLGRVLELLISLRIARAPRRRRGRVGHHDGLRGAPAALAEGVHGEGAEGQEARVVPVKVLDSSRAQSQFSSRPSVARSNPPSTPGTVRRRIPSVKSTPDPTSSTPAWGRWMSLLSRDGAGREPDQIARASGDQSGFAVERDVLGAEEAPVRLLGVRRCDLDGVPNPENPA